LNRGLEEKLSTPPVPFGFSGNLSGVKMVVLNDGVIMEYAEKEKLFEDFMRRWGDRFAMVPPIIRMLASYPEFVRKIGPLVTEGLDRSQLEWVALLAQCTHPIERVFYKDYWVPIQTEENDFVIDISTDNFTLFETQYIQYAPECWYTRMLFPYMSSFLIALDNPDFDFEEYFNFWKKRDSAWCLS
jgi:hypothetical protein